MPRFFVHSVTIGTRLVLINSLLVIAIFAVSALAWRAFDTQHAATRELVRISHAQRYNQDADMMHDALRADAYSALLVREGTRFNADEVQNSLRENAVQFRSDLDELDKLVFATEIHQSVEAVRALAETYISAAQGIAELALRNNAAAVARIDLFEKSFAATKTALEVQTEMLAESVASAERNATSAAHSAKAWILGAGILVNLGAVLLVGVVSRSIRGSLSHVRDNANAMANGNLDVRNDIASRDEVGQLAHSMNAMASNLQSMLGQMRADSERGAFGNQLVEALEMADTETAAHQVIARAMVAVSLEHPMELLLADSSRAHLESATAHPSEGAPGCEVESPFSCVAVRRGNPVVFPDSEALNACPRLRSRPCGTVSAVCVPVSFMGRALGVLHATGKLDAPLTSAQVSKLTTLGIQAGARIGTVRAFSSAPRCRRALTALPDYQTDERLSIRREKS